MRYFPMFILTLALLFTGGGVLDFSHARFPMPVAEAATRAVSSAPAWADPKWDTQLPDGLKPQRADGEWIVPNPKLTTGVFDDVTEAELDQPGAIAARRHVPQSEKAAVYAAYGIRNSKRHPHEIDHDGSIELGGSNAQPNLWPEPYFGAWNAHDKDRLENYLHRQCKAGKLTLAEAQIQIIGNHWVYSYLHYFGEPASAQPAQSE